MTVTTCQGLAKTELAPERHGHTPTRTDRNRTCMLCYSYVICVYRTLGINSIPQVKDAHGDSILSADTHRCYVQIRSILTAKQGTTVARLKQPRPRFGRSGPLDSAKSSSQGGRGGTEAEGTAKGAAERAAAEGFP